MGQGALVGDIVTIGDDGPRYKVAWMSDPGTRDGAATLEPLTGGDRVSTFANNLTASKLMEGDKLNLRVIDGMPAQLVKVFRVEPNLKQCAPEDHCACHGGGPFYCCRCGTAFVIVE